MKCNFWFQNLHPVVNALSKRKNSTRQIDVVLEIQCVLNEILSSKSDSLLNYENRDLDAKIFSFHPIENM